MIVHLGGSVRGTGADFSYMRRIIQTVNEFGGEIALNWVENSKHKAEVQGRNKFKVDWSEIVRSNDAALQRADVFIAEVTTYRLYHGYEIANALAMHKPVLLISRTSFREFAISGVKNPLLSMHVYKNRDELDKIVKEFLHDNSIPNELKRVKTPVSPASYLKLKQLSEQSGHSVEEVAQDLIVREAGIKLSRGHK